MGEVLRQSELFQGLVEDEVARLVEIARPRTLRAGEYLFLLGDSADSLFVVLQGKVDLCFPFSLRGVMRDVAFESKEPGGALGWSALVEPYRFTLSAQTLGGAEVAALRRADLLAIFEEQPRIGYVVLRRLSEMMGRRLLSMQALCARELQRAVGGMGPSVPGAAEAGAAAK